MKISPRIVHFTFISSLAVFLAFLWSPVTRAEITLEKVYEVEKTVNSFYGQKSSTSITNKKLSKRSQAMCQELTCWDFQKVKKFAKEKIEGVKGCTSRPGRS